MSRERTQRRIFDRAVNRLKRRGSDEEKALLESVVSMGGIDDLYQLSIDKASAEANIGVVGYSEDSQTPILDSLIEFFKFLWESGALMELIKLFFGVGLDEAREFYAAEDN